MFPHDFPMKISIFWIFHFHRPKLPTAAGSGHAAVAWLLVEAAIVVTQAAARRGFEVAESFLGTLLGNRALGARWVTGKGWFFLSGGFHGDFWWLKNCLTLVNFMGWWWDDTGSNHAIFGLKSHWWWFWGRLMIVSTTSQVLDGWWCQTWRLFSEIYGIILPIDYFFFRGVGVPRTSF